MTAVIRALLADDQALVRAGFHALLDAQDGSKWSARPRTAARRSTWRARSSRMSC